MTTNTEDVQLDRQHLIPLSEVQKHCRPEDCWIIINGVIYDVSGYLKLHPGGPQAVLDKAGTDATTLPPEARVCPVDPTTIPAPKAKVLTEDETHFELWAKRVLSEKAWAHYRSAADEERSFDENTNACPEALLFRPRMLRDMTPSSTQTAFAGIVSALPIFISPAAMAKLGHPLREVNLTRAAAKYGVVQAISANASCSLEQIFEARKEGQALLYQIYIDRVRSVSEKILRKVEKLGAKAIVFTVDVCWESKRTLDVRAKGAFPKTSLGAFMAMGGLQDRNLTWNDIAFIRISTILEPPALIANTSNHGGRQTDYAPAPIDILYEMRSYRPDMFDKIDVLIDGGVRSGADVVKALALGAKAVGLGRLILDGNATHGEESVERVIDILREEIVYTMKNIGAATIGDLRPEMVGPSGPWVGDNCPLYAPTIPKL
ncbi:mitochondrial fmn-dependent dehydrogenase [Diaporthe sp. PMI_573]|nr:mitochondrial fmn-dependent dehydrogenase [Diaporthaceae sp. PMI_573]